MDCFRMFLEITWSCVSARQYLATSGSFHVASTRKELLTPEEYDKLAEHLDKRKSPLRTLKEDEVRPLWLLTLVGKLAVDGMDIFGETTIMYRLCHAISGAHHSVSTGFHHCNGRWTEDPDRRGWCWGAGSLKPALHTTEGSPSCRTTTTKSFAAWHETADMEIVGIQKL